MNGKLMHLCYQCANELSSSLNRGCRIVGGKKKGRIELEYYDNNDLDALIEILEKIASR